MSRRYRPAADDVLGSVQRVMLGADARNETGRYVGCRMRLTTEIVCREIPDALRKLYLVIVSKASENCLFLRHFPQPWRADCHEDTIQDYESAREEWELSIVSACRQKRDLLNGTQRPHGPVTHAYLASFGGHDMFIYRKSVVDALVLFKSWVTEEVPCKLAKLIQKRDRFYGQRTPLSFEKIVNNGTLMSLLSEKVQCFAEDCPHQSQSYMRCAACRVATYCSVECQRSDWHNRHRQCCGESGTSVFRAPPALMMDVLTAFHIQI